MLSCYECKDRAKYGETQEPPSIFRLNKSIRKLKCAVEKASLQYLKAFSIPNKIGCTIIGKKHPSH